MIEQVARTAPDFDDAAFEYTRVLCERGQLDEAIRALERLPAGGGRELEFLRSLKPPRRAMAGRNDPCPCGSGRKHKHCCINKPHELSLDDRVRWLNQKLADYVFDPRFSARIQTLLAGVLLAIGDGAQHHQLSRQLVATGMLNTWALFDDRIAADYLRIRGPLLPESEREMLADWVTRPLRMYEQIAQDGDVSITLRDSLSGDEFVVHDRIASKDHDNEQRLLGRLGRVGEQLQFVGIPLNVRAASRESALELIATEELRGLHVAVWFGKQLASNMVDRSTPAL